MAGTATGAVSDCAVCITPGIDVATKAAAAKHVVGQGEWRLNGGVFRDLLRASERFLSAKVRAHGIDFAGQGVVGRMYGLCCLPRMAFAAHFCPLFRMRWLCDQALMRFLRLLFLFLAAVTDAAGKIMGGVHLDIAMAVGALACSRHLSCRDDSRDHISSGLCSKPEEKQKSTCK